VISPEQELKVMEQRRALLDSIAAQLKQHATPVNPVVEIPTASPLDCGLAPAAKAAIDKGFHIFGLTPKDKVTLPGSHGFKDSKAPSEESALAPWQEDATRNIGIDLGASDLCVLDFDKPESIPQWLNEIRTYKVASSRGVHVYFRGARKTNKIYVDGTLVGDVKSEGGYVLAEGSVHPSGAVYTVIDDSPIVQVPQRVSELVKHEQERVNASEDGPVIPFGSHDTELTRIAGVLRNAGMNIEKIEEHLIDVCEKRCEGYGSDYKEMCRKIARSIGSKPVGVSQQTYSSGLVLSTTPIAAQQQSARDYSYLLNELSIDRASWIEQHVPKSYQLSKKEPEWLIDEMIYHTGLHLFSGHKGSMKSMLTAMIAEKLCKGESFLFRKNIGRPITVVYIDKENPQTEINRRSYALGLHECENFYTWGDWSADNPPPATFDDVRLLEQIKRCPDTLFIFDSLSSFLDGRDENSTGEMMELMGRARSLARQCAGVIMIHHSAKNDAGQARGNTAIGASTDMAFIVAKNGNKVKISEERFRMCAGYAMRFEMDFTSVFGKYSYKLLEEQVPAGTRKSAEDLALEAADKELTERAFEKILAQYGYGEPINKTQLVDTLGVTSSRAKKQVLIDGPDKPWVCVVGKKKTSMLFIPRGAVWPLPQPEKPAKTKKPKDEKPAEVVELAS
jgi:hypothetical protein